MLLGTGTEKHVKMHDLVRDVAIQIASKEHGFMVKAGVGLKEWPRNTKSFEGCTTISLMGNKLAELPEELVCPQLKVLLLELGYDVNVPERFFKGMKGIEVLSVKRGCLSLKSLELSTNLQSLLLIDCECNDLIWLRKLQRLEILGFIYLKSLEELPDEIGELKEIRLLDVTGCKSLRRIPVNLIGRLKKLEELLIGGYSFKGWDAVGCDSIEGTNAGLTELNSLSHLAVLSLKIPRVECIPRDFVFPRLLRYDIVLGNKYSRIGHPNSTRLYFSDIVLGNWYSRTAHPTSTRLYLDDISAASLNAKTFEQLFPTVSQIRFRNVEGLENIALSCDQMTSHGHGSQKDFFQRLEDVHMYGCRDIRTLFPAKWRQALNNLTNVRIGYCESLEELFELGEAEEGINEEKELRQLSSLTRLELNWLRELKCIWKGPTRHVSLQSLVHLELRALHKLTFIFTPHLAQSLVHLETLKIDDCSGLKHLIGEKDDEREIIPESLGFPKLKTLSISGCDQLEYVFPVSVSPSLLNLEEMTIAFGDNLKQIFYRGEGDALTRDGIINFPQLRELSLSRPKNFTAQLPSLQVLSIEGHEELGNFLAQHQGHTNLREIRITDCKGAQDRRTGHELSLLSLEKLDLSSLPDMRCIWKGLVLSHLTTLKVYDCHKLTHVFTGSMVASLAQLRKIVISGCSELEQIIAKDNDDEKGQILSGSDLQSLFFPNLCEVEIKGCNKLRSLFPVAMASGLPKLRKLRVVDSSQLLGVFWQDDEASPVNVEKQMVLPNLTFLSLDKLPSIVCISLGCDDFLFPRLGNPMVDKCPKLTTKLANKTEGHTNLREIRITDCKGAQDLMLAGHELSLLSLEKLELTSIPDMRCIWKGLVLSHLTSLKVSRCEKLTHVFTGSMVASLVQLQSLDISDCSELEQIIAKDKDDEREIIQDSLGFPKLKTLLISGCDKLEYVFPVSVSPSLLNLEEMKILCCDNLKQIFYRGEGNALTRDGIINFPQLRKLSLKSGCNFFGPKHFTAQFPSLQKLSIDGHEELGDLLAQLQGLTNLRDIYITSSKGAQHLMQAGSFVPNRRTGHEWWQALKNLETMKIEDCESLEEVFELGEAGEGINEEKELLSSLTRLKLENLPELKCIWKGPTRHVSLQSLVHLELQGLDKLTFIFTLHHAQSLVHLETLRIHGCGELKHLIREKDDEREIIQDSLGFPKLKTLLIGGCYKLEYVFPVSVSPSLPNLEEMEIEFGDNLKQIFYRGEGDALTRDGIINFPQQRELSLSRPTNFTVQLPSLQVLAIDGHEELGDLLAQLQGHTNLREIRITDCKGAQDRRTGHELSNLSLEKLELNSMPDMRCIWKGLVASHLTTLEVYYCEKLTHVFTGSMVASLVQLKVLVISDCEELEQIIAKDNDDEKDQIFSGSDLQSLCFPNLLEIEINACNKLRSLFPVAMASGLPKLESLEVADSSQLLGVFGQDDEASPVNVEKQMVLPNLSSLRLENLPSIVCFSLGCDDFLFPHPEMLLTVDKCPKLTTKFARKTNDSTSAQSEVSQSS
ncbi:hypothetical protein OIU85_002672 [Salix viminalis]|uniref:Disease resistance protein At4g27190-like leucine-rich repeats domain-containing protein n=1 Tax=Salix viminalis TaxID=40686 RepID=A0A9Q0VPL6_SALVM|nr:hypothetical protein OIU85_002672 [Salix viminalis]